MQMKAKPWDRTDDTMEMPNKPVTTRMQQLVEDEALELHEPVTW